MTPFAQPRTALALAGVLAVGGATQDASKPRLDVSRAFYAPSFAVSPETVLATTTAGPIDAATYLRYLGARVGRRHLEDLAFDVALAAECRDRGLARSAPRLARSIATQRLAAAARSTHAGGSAGTVSVEGRATIVDEALRDLRVEALVQDDRRRDDTALRDRFAHRYGIGGQRVRVRHVLVSFRATKRRLGADADDVDVAAAARARADEFAARLAHGERFEALLAESDERTARRLLEDPVRFREAGVLAGYNYDRFGRGFAAAVRALDVGHVSAPVRSEQGYHLIHLASRLVTRYDDVVDGLRAEHVSAPVKPSEVRDLRARLLEKYRFRPTK